ncbi:superoxide dismutase family protein [Paracoccus spongiarum]|uniref:Superoxide dismutase family protein n=1 Tax=Paracoccus spongiarum TaxID=3064387 RepID=A0ABT9JCL2_9RHOB|nr:superoxide dismutase family protein [Paracoccus sp. 2205BS29-5]MDP5307557.1 superoxide dismutase family protein [Paracoccus sp. 2205BS29-5]
MGMGTAPIGRTVYTAARSLPCCVALFLPIGGGPAGAEAIIAPVHRISIAGVHEPLGSVEVAQGRAALEIRLRLAGFPPGWHAMHVHDRPDCGPAMVDDKIVAGAAAGPHFDPTGAMAAMASMPVGASMQDGMAMQDDMAMQGGAAMAGMDHMRDRESPPDGNPAAAPRPTPAADPPPPPGRMPRPLGDLPAVHTAADGTTDMRILSYRLNLDQMRGRALMLHEFPEGSDDPRMPKDGGAKIACAVLPE